MSFVAPTAWGRTGWARFARVMLVLFASAWLTGSAWSQPAAEMGARTIERGTVRVVFWPGYEAAARRVLAAAHEVRPFPGLPAEAMRPPTAIFLAPSPSVFDSLAGGRIPDWSAGVAIPGAGLIILPVYATMQTGSDDPAVTLRHELAHLALHAYLPEPIPRWFDEGYATWASGGWDQSAAWQLRLAFLLGRAPPLDSLELEWPRGAERARLAYLLSASAVSYLAERGGERGLPALLRTWRRVGTLDAATRTVFGMTLGQFEDEWRKVVRRRYGWLLAISQVTVFWALVTILLLVFGARRRRRDRERLAAMEAEERMLPPPEEPVDEVLGVDDDPWRR